MTEPPPLDYHNPSTGSPVDPVALWFSFAGGLVVGAAAVGGVGVLAVMFATVLLESRRGPRQSIYPPAVVLTVIWAVTAVVFFIATTRRFRGGRSLSIEARRQNARFFALGFLLGCGVACLVEGVCFGAVAVS